MAYFHAYLCNSLYVDLTLRDGVHLQEAIQTAKEIDQKSKLCGFNQIALDQTASQGYANAQFEMDGGEGLEIVEEFYIDEAEQTQLEPEIKAKSKLTQGKGVVQDVQQGLQASVRTVN